MRKLAFLALAALLISAASYASHSWSTYHWARTTSSFNLTIINSTTDDWDSFVTRAVGDWSGSSKLVMIEDPISDDTSNKTRRRCNSPAGQVRICNLAYGQTGWLGIAGIAIDSNSHITTGYTKLNDTYFSQAPYNQDDWKQSVTCQELGHNVGLGHQDENFNNESLLSCMDYQNPPYEYPNAHDFEQLDTIYGDTDLYNSYDDGGSTGGGSGCNSPPGRGCNKGETPGHNRDIGWGISLGRRGQSETFMRIDPDGTRHITHVTWAIGH
jgi:hypothetical protein